jgi:ABC-2 type transport system permease protein
VRDDQNHARNARLRLYTAVAASGFRRYATYRMATAAGVFTNTVFGVMLSYTYLAVWDQRPHLGGYDQSQALTYVWLGQALFAALAISGGGFEAELMERIRTGDIAIDLYRPADLQTWWLASDLGRIGFQILGRGVIPCLAGALIFRLALPASPLTWVFFLTALLGAVVSFALRYLIALTAFWTLDGAGLRQISMLTGTFFSGMLFPLNAFPGLLGEITRALPWASLLQVPADVLLGRAHGPAVARGLAFQAGWALLLLLAGRTLQTAATRKVVLQGG